MTDSTPDSARTGRGINDPCSTPNPDAGPQIDAAIAQFLFRPQVSQALRATLRHAIIATCFEHGRALKIGRLTELLGGVEPHDTFDDEQALIAALGRFVGRGASGFTDAQQLQSMIESEVSRQLSELKITRSNA